MKVKELNAYLKSLEKIDFPNSVDRIIIGNPDTEIKKIGTCWLPYWETLKEAKRLGVNVIVTHEPTFYHHFDLDAKDKTYPKLIAAKKKWILKNKMAIIRCHDVLDRIRTDFGIPYSWGEALGFSRKDIIQSPHYYNVYKVAAAPAKVWAQKIANRLKKLNQSGVEFYGEGDRMVKSIVVGTGCYANPLKAPKLKWDLFVAIDDAIMTWCQAVYSRDTGAPMVVVNHGTSEDWALKKLADHLNEKFSEIKSVYFPQGCTYRWFAAK